MHIHTWLHRAESGEVWPRAAHCSSTTCVSKSKSVDVKDTAEFEAVSQFRGFIPQMLHLKTGSDTAARPGPVQEKQNEVRVQNEQSVRRSWRNGKRRPRKICDRNESTEIHKSK